MSRKEMKTSKEANHSILMEIYGVLTFVGLVLSYLLNDNVHKSFKIPINIEEFRYLSIVTFLGAGAILILQELFRQSHQQHHSYISAWTRAVLGPMTLPRALLLTVVSSIAEEVFFRLALQPILGVLGVSLLVTLLYLAPKLILITFSSTILATNLIVGTIFEYTEVIYPGLIISLILNGKLLVGHALYCIKNKKVEAESVKNQEESRNNVRS